uniref:Spermatogenesis-associated protein 22 n=1 Tax=Denticeps clupeoides TaxID=299321 RepID=A0AAY4EU57_9TELE
MTSNPSESEEFGPSKSLWTKQTSLPAQPSSGRGFAPLPHPRKPPTSWPRVGQQWAHVKPESSRPSSSNVPSQMKPSTSGHQAAQHWAFNRPTGSSVQPNPVPCLPSTPKGQKQATQWRFRSLPEPGKETDGRPDAFHTPTPTPTQVKGDKEPLRILTAAIGGMRHWSRFKDKMPLMFEIFATLDSAVTLGKYGAKSFLMRTGRDVVSCIYYENDLELPRLIRGQVHRCVGNYDPLKDLLTCVSVRVATPSEQRNAQDSVRASDAEMNQVAQCISEI